MFFQDGAKDLFETHRPFSRSETGFTAGKSFRPAADIFEAEDGLLISLDVPGLERDQVEIELDGRRLIVSGSRDFVRDHPGEEHVRLERGFGSFRRAFEVPRAFDPDRITAKLDQGVLTILVARRGERRSIEVESEGGGE